MRSVAFPLETRTSQIVRLDFLRPIRRRSTRALERTILRAKVRVGIGVPLVAAGITGFALVANRWGFGCEWGGCIQTIPLYLLSGMSVVADHVLVITGAVSWARALKQLEILPVVAPDGTNVSGGLSVRAAR
jgi:hypothetical protein